MTTFTGASAGLSTRASRLLQSHLRSLNRARECCWMSASVGMREDRGVARRKALVENIGLRTNSAIVGTTVGPPPGLGG